MTSRSSSPRTDRPRLPTDGEGDAAGLRLHPAAVQGLGDHRIELDRARVGHAARPPGCRDSVMRSWTRLVSRCASCRIWPANRRTASASSAASSIVSASSASAPDRRLELVAGVGDEVPLHLVHPAAFRLVLGEHENEPAAADGAAERRHPDREARRPAAEPGHRDLELAFPDLAVPAHLAGQRGELADHQAIALDQPERAGRSARPQHPVVAVDDHGRGGQHGQDGGDARRQPGGLFRRPQPRAPCLARSAAGPRGPGSYRHATSVIGAGQGGDQ